MLSFIRVGMVMVSLYSNRKLTKTKVSTRKWGISVIDMNVLLFGGTWALVLCVSKEVTA